MYERFSDRARSVMQLANQEALRFNHDEHIHTEHLLLGLLSTPPGGVARTVLMKMGIDAAKVIGQIERLIHLGPPIARSWGKLAQTPQTKKAIEYAMEEARSLNHNYIGTEHILLGLLCEREGVAAQVLMSLGLKLEEVRDAVLNLLVKKP